MQSVPWPECGQVLSWLPPFFGQDVPAFVERKHHVVVAQEFGHVAPVVIELSADAGVRQGAVGPQGGEGARADVECLHQFLSVHPLCQGVCPTRFFVFHFRFPLSPRVGSGGKEEFQSVYLLVELHDELQQLFIFSCHN